MKRTLVALVALAAVVACKNAETNLAGQAYKESLGEMQSAIIEFRDNYEKLEQKIDGHRDSDRAKVVSTIEDEMLPMIDATIAAFEEGIPKGRAYVSKLDDSVSSKSTIAGQLDTFDAQLAGFKGVRKTYVVEAKLFRQPSHEQEELLEIFTARMEAAKKIAGQ